MKARVKLVVGMQFVGSADSGHGVVMVLHAVTVIRLYLSPVTRSYFP